MQSNLPEVRSVSVDTRGMGFLRQLWTVLTHVDIFEVTEDFYYRLPDGTLICIPEGFRFDGNSIPRIFWFIFRPFNSYMFVQGLVHDFGYRYGYVWAVDRFGNFYKMSGGQLFFDKIYYQIGMAANGFRFTNMINKIVLNLFGFVAWRSNRRKNAPELKPSSAVARV